MPLTLAIPPQLSIQSITAPVFFIGRAAGTDIVTMIRLLMSDPSALTYVAVPIGTLEYGATLSVSTSLSPYPSPSSNFVPSREIARNPMFVGRSATMSCSVNMFSTGISLLSIKQYFQGVSFDEMVSETPDAGYNDYNIGKPMYDYTNKVYAPVCGIAIIDPGSGVAISFVVILFPKITTQSLKPLGGSPTSYIVEVTTHGVPFFPCRQSFVVEEDRMYGMAPGIIRGNLYSALEDIIPKINKDFNFTGNPFRIGGAVVVVKGGTRCKLVGRDGHNSVAFFGGNQALFMMRNILLFYHGADILSWIVPV